MLGWWSSELAAMLPASLRRAVGIDQDMLVLGLSTEKLDIKQRGGGREQSLASMPWKDRDRGRIKTDLPDDLRVLLRGLDTEDYHIVLELDPALTLHRTVHVPRAAEAEIRGVLAFEIERQTPFRGDDVYFDHRVDREASADATLAVDLVIVPRRIIDPWIGGLRKLNFDLDRVVVATPGNESETIPIPGLRERRRRGTGAFKLLAALTVILAIAAATTPLMRLKSLHDDLAVAVQKAKSEAEVSRSLQDKVDRLSLGINVIARAKAEASSPLEILQTLSRLLPDGTWVAQLNISGGEVILEGRTDSSTRLVGLLEASPLFDTVKYLAPITRDADGGLERFNFSLRLARG